MNRSRLLGAVFPVLLALHISATEAVVVTFEPDDFQEGQALTNALEGVTLSVANGDGVPQPTSQVVTFQGDYSSTGSLVFGRQVQAFVPDDSWFLTSIFVHSVFRADFDSPVAQVSIDVVRKQPKSGALLAYDSSGALLGTATTAPGAVGTFATATIVRPNADIAYILAGGYPIVSGPPYNVVTLDNFQFNQDVATVTTFNAGDYFPLETGDQWAYQVNGDPNIQSTASVLAGSLVVNGVPTKALETQGPLGTTTNYFTNDGNGIRLHRQISDSGTVTFIPPIQLATATTSLGDEFATNGTATLFLPGQGTFQLGYVATSQVPVWLTTGVPAGQFETVKVVLNVTISGSVPGMPINTQEVDTYWLARHIGAVKASVLFQGTTTVSELVSAFVDHDADGVSATIDNCPVVANPAQTNTDGDEQGDVCDEDDDNDGFADDTDVFPLDPNEWLDTDEDGIGNNADPDDDNDGIPDDMDPYPLGRFNDVSPTYWARTFIEMLAETGITVGCGNNNYCPTSPVTRAQMAVFLERAMRGSDYRPPTPSGNVFNDVSANYWAAGFIEQFFFDGITAGCGNNNYCPEAEVTRDQMAVFLLRAKHGAGYSPPPATGVFNDVPLSHWAVHWIEQLAVEGITAGCGNNNYCPDATVNRDQMAVFLVRTFGL